MIAFILAIISLVAGAFGGIYYVEKFDKNYKTANDFYIEHKNYDFESVGNSEELESLQQQLEDYVIQQQQLQQLLQNKIEYIEYLESNVEVIHNSKTEAFMTIYNNALKDKTDVLLSFFEVLVQNMSNYDFDILKNLYIETLPMLDGVDFHEEFDRVLDEKELTIADLNSIEFVLLTKYVELVSQTYEIKNMLLNGQTDGLNEMLYGYTIGIFHEFFRYFENYALV